MKTYVAMFGAMLAMGTVATSCSSDMDAAQGTAEGKGLVKLSVDTSTGFQTRAVDENSYEDLSQYTVQILDGDGYLVDGCEWAGNDLPSDLVELDNGSYTLKAFAGADYKEVGASTDGFYVAGETTFNVNSNETSISVECTPQCARVAVVFDEGMADYFQNYYVVYEGTKALGNSSYIWSKDNEDPAYLYLTDTETVTATIKLVNWEGNTAEDIVRTKNLGPAQAWTLNISPAASSESEPLGISITIDDSTNDREVEIEIPSEWS